MADSENRDKEKQLIITKDTITTGLREMGLSDGSMIEVHSSLSAFGRVEGGSSSVVDALIEVVGKNGSLIMSAYPVSSPVPLTEEEKARGIKWKVKVFHKDEERSGMGAVVDEFRNRPDVVMGSGSHRVCAWGKDAKLHSRGYRHLVEKDGWVLLMGVGIDRCSSLHLAEDTPLPEEIEAYFKVPDDIKKDYDEKEWSIGYGGTPDDAWRKVYEKANKKGLIKHYKIGQAECLLFKAKDLIELYEEWRRSDPYGLCGVKKK